MERRYRLLTGPYKVCILTGPSLRSASPLNPPPQDFIFAREVRLGTYSVKAATLPPAAVVASKAMAADPRAEPLYGERVPFVVSVGRWAWEQMGSGEDKKRMAERMSFCGECCELSRCVESWCRLW